MYNEYYYDSAESAGAGDFFVSIFFLAISIVSLVALWRVYKKAGYKGWESLVPFYSSYVMCDIVFGNGWYFLLYFFPIVNCIFPFITLYKLARVYNKSAAFGWGMIFLSSIVIIILAFDTIAYVNCIFSFIVLYRLARGYIIYNKSAAFGWGIILFLSLIFLIILAFDDSAYYIGPSARANMMGRNPYTNGYNGYNGFNQNQQDYQNQNNVFQNNGFQNNGFQNDGFQNDGFQNDGFQNRNNPFEPMNNNNYYGNNDNNNFDNNGF